MENMQPTYFYLNTVFTQLSFLKTALQIHFAPHENSLWQHSIRFLEIRELVTFYKNKWKGSLTQF